MNRATSGFKNLYLHILFILLIGVIGVQTLTSCSSDDNNDNGDPTPLSSSGGGSSSSGGGSSSGNGSGSHFNPNIQYIDFADSRDNKTYKSVVIGTQTWMAENLNYAASGSKCGNGSSLSDNNTASCDTYGRLYNWATAQTACPAGWVLPTNTDWDKLYRYADNTGGTGSPYLSATAGKKLKAASGWNGSGNGTDQFGFSALPGGGGSSGGNFGNTGDIGYWWSASQEDSDMAYRRDMISTYLDASYQLDGAYYDVSEKSRLFSVRCLKDVSGGGSSSSSGDGPVPPTPTKTTFVDSRDNTTYMKVTIGTQTWMAENLNYDVPDNTTDVCYENKSANCATYGRLYNWSTAMAGSASSNAVPSGIRGICPSGWHIPSDAEWTILENAVGGSNTAGIKLKSTTDWYNCVPSGTGWGSYYFCEDTYGFSALPGGSCDSRGYCAGGDGGYSGSWLSTTQNRSDGIGRIIYFRKMLNNDEAIDRADGYESFQHSIRCIKDTP